MTKAKQNEPKALDQLTERKREWLAWQVVGEEWKKAGIADMDDAKMNSLVASIVLWGECLARLRLSQTPGERGKAMDSAQRRKVG